MVKIITFYYIFVNENKTAPSSSRGGFLLNFFLTYLGKKHYVIFTVNFGAVRTSRVGKIELF